MSTITPHLNCPTVSQTRASYCVLCTWYVSYVCAVCYNQPMQLLPLHKGSLLLHICLRHTFMSHLVVHLDVLIVKLKSFRNFASPLLFIYRDSFWCICLWHSLPERSVHTSTLILLEL